MATERNYQTLQDTIRRLPNYAPSASVWDAVEHQLEQDRSEAQLQEAIRQLPSYAPKGNVWDRIETELSQPVSPVRLRLSRRTWISIAATILAAALMLVLWLHKTPQPQEQVQIVYAEAQSNVAKADWDEDDETIADIANAYARRASFLKNAEGTNLLTDLKELNDAKAEIKTMMAKYGQDPQLVRTIAQIERERSAIVKKMAQEI